MTAATESRPIKVMNLIARLNIGGPAIHVSLLTQHLGPPEFESTLVAGRVPETEGDMGYYATECGVTPIYLETLSREVDYRDDFRSILAVYRLLRRERPDILHTHTAKAGFVGRIAGWLARVPVIVHTYHGHVLRGYFGPRKTALFRRYEQWAAGRSHMLLAVSAKVREELLELGVGRPETFRVVELGLDLQRFADAAESRGALRDELGLADDVPLLGTSGRLVPIKHQSLLLRATAKLRESHPGLHLVLIGDGELREALAAEAAELGLVEVTHFLGWRTDLAPLLADLDVFALTSRNEGTPISILEAAAAGLPVVATSVGGVPDVITDGETGWLVPDDDADALAAALAEVLADPAEARRRGRAAQEHCLARFGVARLRDELAALYHELLAKRRRRGRP